jgi:hypothetical protein
MYERLVTTAFLVNQPDKVDDFIVLFCAATSSLNTLRDIYNADELARMIPVDKQEKVEREYEEAIKEGRFTEPVCKRTDKRKTLSSWINIAMPGLAESRARPV